MKVEILSPRPDHFEAFKRDRCRFIPEVRGCYALTTFSGVVLYIGRSSNLRRRMRSHLDDPKKTGIGTFGRASLFYWLNCADDSNVERTWMNIHIHCEGSLPDLNRIYASTSV